MLLLGTLMELPLSPGRDEAGMGRFVGAEKGALPAHPLAPFFVGPEVLLAVVSPRAVEIRHFAPVTAPEHLSPFALQALEGLEDLRFRVRVREKIRVRVRV